MNKLELKNSSILNIDDAHYGGNQLWFYESYGKKRYSNTGCGVVASANSLIYLAFTRKEYRDLYPFDTLNKINYSEYLLLISRNIKPRRYGIPTIGVLRNGVNRYCDKNGIELQSKSISLTYGIDKIIDFIKSGLIKNTPILSIYWNHKNRILNNHWVTITGLELGDNSKIIISSWGDKYSIDIDDFFYNSVYNGLIYFY